MARLQRTFWQRHRFKLNGLILILPIWFYYESLNPVFPPALNTQDIGNYQITPMPFNMDPPYAHDGSFVKDFLLIFNKGDISHIRQAYLNIGEQALPIEQLQQGSDGILHGSRHGQHVHAIAPAKIEAQHRVWLTMQDWQGELLVTSWDVPHTLVL